MGVRTRMGVRIHVCANVSKGMPIDVCMAQYLMDFSQGELLIEMMQRLQVMYVDSV